MGKILRAEFHRDHALETLISAVLVEARRRSGMSRADFAQAINRALERNPGLLDETVRAYEDGRALPVADVYLAALELGGIDIRGAITAWLRQTPAMLLGLLATSWDDLAAATAAVSPFW